MKKYIMLAAVSLPLGACVVEDHRHGRYYDAYPQPVHVKVRHPVVVDYDDYDDYDGDHPHRGHFCPPGQAKKGNC